MPYILAPWSHSPLLLHALELCFLLTYIVAPRLPSSLLLRALHLSSVPTSWLSVP